MMGTSDDVNRSAPRSWRWTDADRERGRGRSIGSALVEVDRASTSRPATRPYRLRARGGGPIASWFLGLGGKSAPRSWRWTEHHEDLLGTGQIGSALVEVDRTVRASAKRQAQAAMACMTSVKTRPVPVWVDMNLQWPAEDPLTANIRPAPALGDEGWALICGNGLQRAALSRQRAAGHQPSRIFSEVGCWRPPTKLCPGLTTESEAPSGGGCVGPDSTWPTRSTRLPTPAAPRHRHASLSPQAVGVLLNGRTATAAIGVGARLR